MKKNETIYILGGGAVGLALAVRLANKNLDVIAVRTSRQDYLATTVEISSEAIGGPPLTARVKMISLSNLSAMEGWIVVTAKSFANREIARQLNKIGATGPLIIMQNGLGVETPFIEAGFPDVFRCILYLTGEKKGESRVLFRAIQPSPIGLVRGNGGILTALVERLSTPNFEFRVEQDIQREIWQKAIINSVFNSICPLLDVDNGIFSRSEPAASLANEVVEESLQVSARLNLDLNADQLMEQIFKISQSSDGQLISTLQDIRHGRPTEIDSLNLEIARTAESLNPKVDVTKIRLLGNLILIRSNLAQISQRL